MLCIYVYQLSVALYWKTSNFHLHLLGVGVTITVATTVCRNLHSQHNSLLNLYNVLLDMRICITV